MRYSWDSSMYLCSLLASALADLRSWPNGFSTTTRCPFETRSAAARPLTTVANSDGGISR